MIPVGSENPATEPAKQQSAGAPQAAPRVILFDRGKKRRKRRYTLGTRALQQFGTGVSKASFRLSNAVAEGLDTFYRRSRKSSRRSRDGAIRDIFQNSARGFRDASSQFGKIPYDIARRMPTRRFLRSLSQLLGV